MFFSTTTIKTAFKSIGKIDPNETGKARQEKVSALRYLIATSELLRLNNEKTLDLSINASHNREAFKNSVSNITRIGNTNHYTVDFLRKFEENIGSSVSSNFLTTRVEKSRSATVATKYPGRYGTLLNLLDEKISLDSEIKWNLISGYNFNEIRIPLVIWLLRAEDLGDFDTKKINLQQVLKNITDKLKERFEDKLVSALKFSEEELGSFIDYCGKISPEIFTPQIASIDTILSDLEKSTDLSNTSPISEYLHNNFLNELIKSNLFFDSSLVLRFVATLLTKRFCILTGLAGSGKTKLAEAFALWLCESEQQYRLVAVGADWTSNENLLGYADALQPSQYRAPVNGVLELLLRAQADEERPYFLILDEMNLSHVERYFADFLSAMESDNAPLSLHGVAAGLALNGAVGTNVPAELQLPKNLFIIGTVNVDETTYMFSPKVLDRANVMEFRATEDQMAVFLDNPTGVHLKALEKQGVPFASAFVARALGDADIATLTDANGQPLSPQLKSDLIAIFSALKSAGAEFGFRSAKEIVRFMVIHKELSGPGWVYKDALDAQVLQKLMPKLHGSARKLDEVLKTLADFAAEANRDLPMTREKISRMQGRLKRDGFTSFAEA